ncbi:MAG: radical SAM protein [Methanosphaera sp.]|nr:radical SAM protein [Methanosphaera sp.]
MTLRIHQIINGTKVEGPGNRTCIFLQGCLKHCKGCNSPQTWDLNGGSVYTVDELSEMILNDKNIEGVTFSGGEPLLQSKELYELSKLLKSNNLSIVLFTGYSYDLIRKVNDANWNNLLSLCDLLITEPFIEKLKTTTKIWVGSSNQKYYFLSDRYKYLENELHTLENKVEVRLNKDGSLIVLGMGDNGKIKEFFKDII